MLSCLYTWTPAQRKTEEQMDGQHSWGLCDNDYDDAWSFSPCHCLWSGKVGEILFTKVKVNVDLCSTSSWEPLLRLRLSGVDHTVLPANTPHLPLPRSSPEGATTEWTVIAPADEVNWPREDERLSWLTYSGRFTHINGYPSAAGPVQSGLPEDYSSRVHNLQTESCTLRG